MTDFRNDVEYITTAKATFEFSLTNQEAFEIVHNPKGKVAKEMRKYVSEMVTSVAKKCLKQFKEDKTKRDVM